MVALVATGGTVTPTLGGRWQTRLFLLVLLGGPITAVFALLYHDAQTPFALLGYVLLLGCGWDIGYNDLQMRRWNHDWPPLLALLAGLWEGVFLWAILALLQSANHTLPGVSLELTNGRFATHYLTVFLATWLANHSLLLLLFPRWRFHGGQWL